MIRAEYILFGHAPEPALSSVEVGQAITTRYFVKKKQNELNQLELLRRFANTIKKHIMLEQTFNTSKAALSLVQL
jgi:hypothetical protein